MCSHKAYDIITEMLTETMLSYYCENGCLTAQLIVTFAAEIKHHVTKAYLGYSPRGFESITAGRHDIRQPPARMVPGR